MHLTRTEIESRLWPPGRDFPCALVCYSCYCTLLFPKKILPPIPLCLFSWLQHLLWVFISTFHSFTGQWKERREKGRSLLLVVIGESEGWLSGCSSKSCCQSFLTLTRGRWGRVLVFKWRTGIIGGHFWDTIKIVIYWVTNTCQALCLALRAKGKNKAIILGDPAPKLSSPQFVILTAHWLQSLTEQLCVSETVRDSGK